METKIAKEELTVIWNNGIHARPTGMLVQAMQTVNAMGQIEYNGAVADLSSFLNVSLLGVEQDKTVTVTTVGPERDKAMKLIKQIFQTPIGGENVSSKKLSAVH